MLDRAPERESRPQDLDLGVGRHRQRFDPSDERAHPLVVLRDVSRQLLSIEDLYRDEDSSISLLVFILVHIAWHGDESSPDSLEPLVEAFVEAAERMAERGHAGFQP